VEYSLAINDTELIRCTSQCSQIILSFAQRLVFPSQCQENNYEYALACGIEYRIDYDKEEIVIDFQATNETGSLENQKPSEFLVQTIHIGLSKNSTEQNFINRKYGCNTNNDCAKQSYLNIINYLITEGQEGLDLIRTKLQNDSLIVGTESKRRCIDSHKGIDKPSTKCPIGLCFIHLEYSNLNEEQSYKYQRCDGENRPFLFSEIEHHIPSSIEKEREVLKYRCNKNVCNRNDFIDKIKYLVTEFTNGTLKIQSNKSISGKNRALINYQTISLVSFLFLIQLFI
jgi:hypothetical protein